MFLSFGKVTWKTNRSIAIQINEYIEKLGKNFESVMNGYFEEFKKTMKQRVRIPVSLVEKHVKDLCFLVDIDYTYIQVVVPRVRWLKPLGYELYIDEADAAITPLLVEEVDKSAKPFGTYENVKEKIISDKKCATVPKKINKLVKKIKEQFGVGEEDVEEEEEEEEEAQGPLAITQGLGDDQEEETEEVEKIEKEKETPKAAKKRKAEAPPAEKPKAKKAGKPSLEKLRCPQGLAQGPLPKRKKSKKKKKQKLQRNPSPRRKSLEESMLLLLNQMKKKRTLANSEW
jgi:hypothetical protein